jgi:hypothetical protein
VRCAAATLGETTSCSSYTFHWNGAEHGFGGENIDGLAFSGAIALPPPLPTPAVLTATGIYLNALGGTGTGLSFNYSDILHYDLTTGVWSMVFDGSDVGVTVGVDGFHLETTARCCSAWRSPPRCPAPVRWRPPTSCASRRRSLAPPRPAASRWCSTARMWGWTPAARTSTPSGVRPTVACS